MRDPARPSTGCVSRAAAYKLFHPPAPSTTFPTSIRTSSVRSPEAPSGVRQLPSGRKSVKKLRPAAKSVGPSGEDNESIAGETLSQGAFVIFRFQGPTPAEFDMPGAKKCTSTRLQMEIEARRQADKKVEALESRLDNMQQLLEKLLQQQKNPSGTPNGSNNSPHVNLQSQPSLVEQLENHDDDMGSHAEDEIDNTHLSDDENILMTRHTVVFPEEPHDEEIKDDMKSSRQSKGPGSVT